MKLYISIIFLCVLFSCNTKSYKAILLGSWLKSESTQPGPYYSEVRTFYLDNKVKVKINYDNVSDSTTCTYTLSDKFIYYECNGDKEQEQGEILSITDSTMKVKYPATTQLESYTKTYKRISE